VADAVLATHQYLMLPSHIPAAIPNINLLTVFMSEHGQIARASVELFDNARFRSLKPQPVMAGDFIDFSDAPYSVYNPPPVPAEAFHALELDAGQIGQTGFLLVTRGIIHSQQRRAALPHSVLVRYAWPRRPGEEP
jgi:hypothetical protein